MRSIQWRQHRLIPYDARLGAESRVPIARSTAAINQWHSSTTASFAPARGTSDPRRARLPGRRCRPPRTDDPLRKLRPRRRARRQSHHGTLIRLSDAPQGCASTCADPTAVRQGARDEALQLPRGRNDVDAGGVRRQAGLLAVGGPRGPPRVCFLETATTARGPDSVNPCVLTQSGRTATVDGQTSRVRTKHVRASRAVRIGDVRAH